MEITYVNHGSITDAKAADGHRSLVGSFRYSVIYDKVTNFNGNVKFKDAIVDFIFNERRGEEVTFDLLGPDELKEDAKETIMEVVEDIHSRLNIII